MIEQTIFNNRYRLDRKLGEGGMATVYCGTDTVLRRRVAVKVLRPQYAADDEFVRRFYHEAESAARLSHPNIVNTYDVGREGDMYYIVMELVDGPSLAEIIAADGKLPEPVAIDYAAQICTGLAYAHRTGLLHRDIKPANILVTKDDVVKLSDFGIARAVSAQTMAMTKPGLVMGSVFYISPEQAQGQELHETSDLYSVGVVIYQMLTGALPFIGESPVTVALKHIADPVPMLDASELGISPALAAIVNKLLQKNPENRFRSASEVASALREARERPSVAAYPMRDDAPTHFGPAAPPPRRSPMPDRAAYTYSSLAAEDERRSRIGSAVVAAVIVVALLATAAGYWIFGRGIAAFGGNVVVGNYSNMSDVDAEAAIVNAGLVARVIKTASDTVPANEIIRQNPAPGTAVSRNSVVELQVSNGLPLIGLRDVRSFSVNDAQRILTDDGFKVKENRKYDNAPKDSVIDQKPKPRTQLRKGSLVTLVVSDGPQSVAVPNFVNMSLSDAQALASKAGVSIAQSQSSSYPGVPANTIAWQDASPGSLVDRGTSVRVLVSTGNAGENPAQMISVPSVIGQAYADAISTLGSENFTAKVQFSVQATQNGEIVAQDPAAGTQAQSGSIISLTLSVSGEVPDTVGMSFGDAQATLQSFGYQIGEVQYTTTQGADGKVVGTDPEAGTNLPPGSSVTLVVNGVQH
jgi:eukaryotic-like serine/threonine-protein kinase